MAYNPKHITNFLKTILETASKIKDVDEGTVKLKVDQAMKMNPDSIAKIAKNTDVEIDEEKVEEEEKKKETKLVTESKAASALLGLDKFHYYRADAVYENAPNLQIHKGIATKISRALNPQVPYTIDQISAEMAKAGFPTMHSRDIEQVATELKTMGFNIGTTNEDDQYAPYSRGQEADESVKNSYGIKDLAGPEDTEKYVDTMVARTNEVAANGATIWDRISIAELLDTIGQDQHKFSNETKGTSEGDWGPVEFKLEEITPGTLYLKFDSQVEAKSAFNTLSASLSNPYEFSSRFDQMPDTIMVQFSKQDELAEAALETDPVAILDPEKIAADLRNSLDQNEYGSINVFAIEPPNKVAVFLQGETDPSLGNGNRWQAVNRLMQQNYNLTPATHSQYDRAKGTEFVNYK